MIKHIVVFKMKNHAEGADKSKNVQEFKSRLEALKGLIDEIRFFEVGINVTDASAAYDLALYSEFDTIEALHRYQKHPEHLKVADFMQRVCDSRVVADYVV